MSTGGKQLVKDGVWQVPAEERPANWQAMGIKEPEGSTAVAVMEEPESIAVAIPESAIPAPTYSVASHPSELVGLQDSIAPWARVKLEEAQLEHKELTEAIEHAKKCKWNYRAMLNAAGKALSRITFYDKVVAALEAGYMLFPPVPNADTIAIRAHPKAMPAERYRLQESYQGRPQTECSSSNFPMGAGAYKNPSVKWSVVRSFKRQNPNGSQTDMKEWQAMPLSDPVFPLLMAKPQVVEAVNSAMELKVFDEIRMFPFERRGDPCLLGAIVEKGTDRRHYFLISWRIDAKDI